MTKTIKTNSKKAFTLIGLMAAAVVAAIMIPTYNQYATKQQQNRELKQKVNQDFRAKCAIGLAIQEQGIDIKIERPTSCDFINNISEHQRHTYKPSESDIKWMMEHESNKI